MGWRTGELGRGHHHEQWQQFRAVLVSWLDLVGHETPWRAISNHKCSAVVTGAKDMGVWVDEKLNMTQKCALTAQKSSNILGCIQSSTGSRSREVVLSLCSALLRAPPGALHSDLIVRNKSPEFTKYDTLSCADAWSSVPLHWELV